MSGCGGPGSLVALRALRKMRLASTNQSKDHTTSTSFSLIVILIAAKPPHCLFWSSHLRIMLSAKKKSKKDKKRRHSSANTPSTKTKPVKEEPSTKKIKFESGASEPATCLTFPSKHTRTMKINVQESDSAKDPVVVSFPSGLPSGIVNDAQSTGEEAGHSNPPTFTWTSARKSSSKGRILVGTDDTCTYSSMNDGRGYDGRLTKSYVAIYHKPSKTVKFIPASEKGTVFAMNQRVTDYEDSQSFDFGNMSMSERRRMVFESFGSNKKKKVLRSQDANVVEMKSVVGAGEGMMRAIGSQIEGGAVSESNKKVMDDTKSGKNAQVSESSFGKYYFSLMILLQVLVPYL